jgi:hypothetical protein
MITGKVISTFEHFERGALAVVANSDYIFGLTRMLTATVENELIAISVFRSEALARKWIQEIRELHNKEVRSTD